ncbi:MAG TPA: SusE domain-containing protein [Lentimicrobium sp.]|nr:SusE domain-containing protein [Lentimicrobium sp.]
MKSKFIIYLAFIGLLGLFTSCEKDGDTVTMKDPVAPSLTTIPDLTLERANGTETLVFVGTPVDPGFEASANYTLEAAAAGTNFADPVTILTTVHPEEMSITVSDLNGILLKKFPADQASNVEFRLKAVLVVDSGTGAAGSASSPMVYISEVKTVEAVLYGLPRLNLIDSGMDQKIESALGDGKYKGFVKINAANPFKLEDPETGIIYGASGGNLVPDGAGIVPPTNDGWHILTADLSSETKTYGLEEYRIGLVGSATPNGWDSPDQKMDYNPVTGLWEITIDLVVGDIKFRKNDGWAWNLGGPLDNLVGDGANIPIAEAGNYTITLNITSDADKKGTATVTKN